MSSRDSQNRRAPDDVLVFKVKPSHLINVFFYLKMIGIVVAVWVMNEAIIRWITETYLWMNNAFLHQDPDLILILAKLSFLLLVFTPLLAILYRFIKTHLNVHYFYEDRLVYYHGVFNRHRENIEFYRVKDHMINRPIYLSIFGLSVLTIMSTDRRNPEYKLKGVRKVYEYESRLRQLFEKAKDDGRGREVDVV